MKSFDYFQPTEIRFGKSRIQEVGRITRRLGTRCLLVTGPRISKRARVFEQVKQNLEQAGIPVAHFDQVIPNPTTGVVSAGAAVAKEFSADVVLGLGGGSSMDTAKAIAVEATHKGTSWDYLYFRKSQPTEKTLPIIAVTTTSGTGSQVTQVAVVTNPEEKNKSALFHSLLYPEVSIVDPELMLTVPSPITAMTGFDVFTHAFESYIHPGGSPYTDLMALETIRLLSQNLPTAVADGKNLEARTQMALADTFAGLCIANAGVTLPHGIGMAMGGIYPHVAHGEALACLYPAIMRYTFKYAIKKFAVVGRIFDPSLKKFNDETAAEKSCEALDRFLKKIGLWISLEDLKIPEEEFKTLATASLVLPDYKNHPRLADRNEVLDLLQKSFRR